MVKLFPSKTHIGDHMLHPETLMLNYGYDPQLSEGAIKPPVFLTSTFVFKTADDGQRLASISSSGRREPARRDGARGRSTRASTTPTAKSWRTGSLSTKRTEKVRIVLIRNGSHRDHDPRFHAPQRRDLLHSQPLYGGTETLLHQHARASVHRRGRLRRWDRRGRGASRRRRRRMSKGRVAMILIETPANPTNGLVDIAMIRSMADTIGKAQGTYADHRRATIRRSGPCFSD